MNDFNQKRISILLGFFTIMAVLLCWRLFDKQILEHSLYVARAENQYSIKKDVPAQRGKIYSSDKMLLAANSRLYDLLVVPNYIPSASRMGVAQSLVPIVGKSAGDIYALINNNKYYVPPLKKRMDENEAQSIADMKIKGVSVVAESVRSYPQGQLASQLLGFVDSASEGKYGLEGYYNDQLQGIGGEISGSRDTQGQLFDISSQTGAQNGADLYLTIDSNIQYEAEQVLAGSVQKYEADSGSIIIVDPSTGAILAMASYPTFDPNNYNQVTDQSVFNDTAINNAWEPGSVFKPIVMAAAIDQGVVQPDTQNNFSESVKVGNYTIQTALKKAYGLETMTKVLENSDNVAMVWISNLLGKETMYKYLQSFGFGRKTGIELSGEASGNLANVKNWSAVQQATISFGQGVTATPLQVLMATSAIANGGKLMQPYIVSKIVSASGQTNQTQSKIITQVIRPDTASKVSQMLVSVVDNGNGKPARVTGYSIAGKTGTAQVPSPNGGYYSDRFNGSFAGFAPASNAKFAMIIRMDHPKAVAWAEDSAAPAFGVMAKWLFDYMDIAPDRPIAN
jgi:cell division protein FtsI/penicillin-binding protein 2